VQLLPWYHEGTTFNDQEHLCLAGFVAITVGAVLYVGIWTLKKIFRIRFEACDMKHLILGYKLLHVMGYKYFP
jgi:hypothetical protein